MSMQTYTSSSWLRAIFEMLRQSHEKRIAVSFQGMHLVNKALCASLCPCMHRQHFAHRLRGKTIDTQLQLHWIRVTSHLRQVLFGTIQVEMQMVFPTLFSGPGMIWYLFTVQQLLQRIAATDAVPCWNLFPGMSLIFTTVRASIPMPAGEAIMILLPACVCPDVGCPFLRLGEVKGLQQSILHESVPMTSIKHSIMRLSSLDMRCPRNLP